MSTKNSASAKPQSITIPGKKSAGEMESSVDYELTADEFCNLK